MKIKYLITQDASTDFHQVDIGEDEFLQLQSAYSILQNTISSEEQFDAVARNFFDLESDMLATALEFTYVAVGDGIKNMAARRLLNRRLLNFLSAARGYMDHQRHVVGKIFGPDDPRSEKAVEMFRKFHSENFGYRLMEELRNACQHRIFPVHSIIFQVINERENNALQSRIMININVDELRADKKFKPSVLAELESYGETVDLKPFARNYIQGIAEAHQYFRENASNLAKQAGCLLEKYVSKYRSDHPKINILTLHAVQMIEDVCNERVPLVTGLPEYYAYLAKQNLHFKNASIKYVSNSVSSID